MSSDETSQTLLQGVWRVQGQRFNFIYQTLPVFSAVHIEFTGKFLIHTMLNIIAPLISSGKLYRLYSKSNLFSFRYPNLTYDIVYWQVH